MNDADRFDVGTVPAACVRFVVSVDLGNNNDSTAITVLEVTEAVTNFYQRGCSGPAVKRVVDLTYLVAMMHRPALGVGYPRILDQVEAIMADLPAAPKLPILVFDATGLGAPVVQQARTRGMKAVGLTITSGATPSFSGMNWTVPKELLVGDLRLAMHNRIIKVANFPARERLEAELQAFTARLSPSGRATFAAAGAEHDDTVLSLSMAVVAAKRAPQPTRTVKFSITAGI